MEQEVIIWQMIQQNAGVGCVDVTSFLYGHTHGVWKPWITMSPYFWDLMLLVLYGTRILWQYVLHLNLFLKNFRKSVKTLIAPAGWRSLCCCNNVNHAVGVGSLVWIRPAGIVLDNLFHYHNHRWLRWSAGLTATSAETHNLFTGPFEFSAFKKDNNS